MTACGAPLSLEALVDYTAGDLPPAEEQRLEEHYFGCAACARRLSAVEALGRGVRELVRRGAVRASVTADLVERLEGEGLSLRRYALVPGALVPCTAAPGDDFVVVELAARAGAAGAAQVDVLSENLADGTSARQTLQVSVDRSRGSIVLLFPAQAVRAYPRSRWTLHVTFEDDPGARLGAYVLDHTPWQELTAGADSAPQ